MKRIFQLSLAAALLLFILGINGCCNKSCPTPTPLPPTYTAAATPGDPAPRITVMPKATRIPQTATGAVVSTPTPSRSTPRPGEMPPASQSTATADIEPSALPPTPTLTPTPTPDAPSPTPPDSPLPSPTDGAPPTDDDALPSPTTPAEDDWPTPEPTPIESSASPTPLAQSWRIEAVGMHTDADLSTVQFSGVAVNLSSETQEIEEISVTVYDDMGEILADAGDVDGFYPARLAPAGGKAPFFLTAYLHGESQPDHYEFNVESAPASEPIQDIDILIIDWWPAEGGGYVVEGEFENTSQLEDFLQILAMFYDSEGRLVALGELFDQEKLLAADRHSFALDEFDILVADFGESASKLELFIWGR